MDAQNADISLKLHSITFNLLPNEELKTLLAQKCQDFELINNLGGVGWKDSRCCDELDRANVPLGLQHFHGPCDIVAQWLTNERVSMLALFPTT